MPDMSEAISKGMDSYNYRRWIAWLVALGSLAWGSYELWALPGVFVALGICSLAVAVSQEIRASVFPIGMVAIQELDRRLGPQER